MERLRTSGASPSNSDGHTFTNQGVAGPGGVTAPENMARFSLDGIAEFTAITMYFTNGILDGENIFPDVSLSDWFYSSVVGAIQYG